jgi:hypothetical protein
LFKLDGLSKKYLNEMDLKYLTKAFLWLALVIGVCKVKARNPVSELDPTDFMRMTGGHGDNLLVYYGKEASECGLYTREAED